MARKKDGRDRQLPIRVDEAELEEIHRRAAAAGFKSTGEWLRRLALGYEPAPARWDRVDEIRTTAP